MKMARFVLLTFFAGSLILGLNSCNKDKESPTVTYLQPMAADMYYFEGSWLRLEAFIDDDAGLTDYKVYITDSAGIIAPDLEMIREAQVVGTGFLHQDSVVIPNGAGSWYDGSYNFNIIATDAEGNEVTETLRFFVAP